MGWSQSVGVVMVERGQQRWILALGVGLAGVLFAVYALLFGGGNSAGAQSNCSVSHDGLDSEEQAFLGLINNYRAQNGLGALTASTNLNRAAAWMAEDLGANNYFAHTDSLGRSPYARAIACGYPAGAGENLAAGGGASTAAAAFQMWQNSPGHNSNMLGSFYQQIGIARHYTAGSTYGWYWGTNFGTMNDGTGGGGAGNPTATNTPTRTPTRTPTNTPVPQQPTNTPVPQQPTSTPTVNQGGGGSTPTQPAATSTPTQTPTPGNSGGGSPSATPTHPLPPTVPGGTSTPGNTATPTSTATTTPTPKPTNTPGPTSTPTAPGNSLPLSPGANLVAWPGGNMSAQEAFGGNTTVAVVYEWEGASGQWKRYFPGLPGFLNNLRDVRQGSSYWVIAKTKSALTFAR